MCKHIFNDATKPNSMQLKEKLKEVTAENEQLKSQLKAYKENDSE